MRGRLAGASLAIVLASTGVAQVPAKEGVHVAGGQHAPILADVLLPPGLSSVAIRPDGRSAVVIATDPDQPERSRLWIYDGGGAEPRTTSVPGQVRSALFSADGLQVFLILYKPAKRRQGEAQLASLDPLGLKLRNLLRLPSTATALDHWVATDSLLVATLNEIRTIRLDGLRSGPLFRIPGRNLAVACLAGSDVVLVGQDGGLLLIHLDDPHEEESMPVRARAATPAPVVELAAAPDGTEALARLSDGRFFRVSLDPLTATAVGDAAAVAALRKDDDASRVPLDPLPPPVVETAAVSASAADAAPEENPSQPQPAVDEGSTDSPAPPEPTAEPPVAPPAPEEPRPGATAREDPTPWPPGQPPQVWGRLSGPAREQVESVILYGPDNLLREALRVVPDPDGIWFASGLEAGRYQVRLAAAQDMVLVSEPPFASVDLAAGVSRQLAEIRVVRTYAP